MHSNMQAFLCANNHMDKMPFFSIITPTLNSSDRLDRTIRSVEIQNVPVEHLVMDGGSDEQNLAQARAVVKPAKHIRMYSERDSGVYDGMNKGIALARGTY